MVKELPIITWNASVQYVVYCIVITDLHFTQRRNIPSTHSDEISFNQKVNKLIRP